ncbi:hypothetical protein PR048_028590 [Dryococelus australis]|uniref:Uncharacterized protein n=1 Tax=Dryococelus australis TaxID=614101 RepID=A0ABQ9GBF5_9NEOP|nr:hypothetical protein PR048_028590 [Dryococelus australis]
MKRCYSRRRPAYVKLYHLDAQGYQLACSLSVGDSPERKRRPCSFIGRDSLAKSSACLYRSFVFILLVYIMIQQSEKAVSRYVGRHENVFSVRGVSKVPSRHRLEGTFFSGSCDVVVRLLASHLGEPDSIPGGVSSRTMLLAYGFSRGYPVPPPLSAGAAPYSPRFTLIGSQGVDLTTGNIPNRRDKLCLLKAPPCASLVYREIPAFVRAVVSCTSSVSSGLRASPQQSRDSSSAAGFCQKKDWLHERAIPAPLLRVFFVESSREDLSHIPCALSMWTFIRPKTISKPLVNAVGARVGHLA